MRRAKVIGTACDVCEPDDVRNLANFAISELGSIDIWVIKLCNTIFYMYIACI